MNYQNILNNYGYFLYDTPYYQIVFMALFIQLLTSYTNIKFVYLTILNILGYLTIGVLKNYFKTDRPLDCLNSEYDICPESYDIPSGHSFFSVFWTMIIYKTLNNYYYKNVKMYLIIYLVFIPLSRYISGVHSIGAIIVGSVMGIIWFVISTFIN